MAVGNNPAEMQKQITKYFYRLSADDDIADATTEIGDDDEVGLEVSESTRKILTRLLASGHDTLSDLKSTKKWRKFKRVLGIYPTSNYVKLCTTLCSFHKSKSSHPIRFIAGTGHIDF